MLGADLFGGEQPQLGRPELLGPPHVERLGPPHELPGLRGEPPPQHLIGTGIHIALRALGRGGGGGGGDVAVHAYGSLDVRLFSACGTHPARPAFEDGTGGAVGGPSACGPGPGDPSP
ncbi:hypothetical protein Smic_38020 [Streptomyces microflavus]|uniref:Uncharacterized protein n=1 Tax=Streptomyces microflavus TaxID=1919 RepID=A0A7J0CRU1_STRMI|nr:hypothetical protein Smic_38020 [Streptomyces microflavus]